jgi:aminoglycoside 6'-N-acetyltransferase
LSSTSDEARTGQNLSFRALGRGDFPLLSQWLSAPHVQNWWREEFDAGAVEARYGPVVDGTDQTECFLAESQGVPIGFVQRYRLGDNPEWERTLAVAGTWNNGAGIDYFIGPELLIGRGLGPQIIDRFVSTTWSRYPEIDAIVVNVSPDNRRSWRALEKCGFTRVWSGPLVSDDPSDQGMSHVYARHRSHHEVIRGSEHEANSSA